MAASSAILREVRWRVTGTTAWSDIATCSPVAELRLEGLDRDKTYDVEVRDISACGAPSAWVLHTAVVPDVAAGNITLSDLSTAASDAQADATSALNQLTDIASDGKLTALEKIESKQRYNTLTAEQSGIDAQATSYGITTEKTNYDSAITSLKSYLKDTVGVLDASFVWTGTTGTTAITRTTWDSTWTTVYTAKTALLNAIYAAAKTKSDAAQASANSALYPAANLVPNTSGENGSAGWTGSTAISSVSAPDGYQLRAAAPGASGTYAYQTDPIPVTAGKPYTASADMFADAAATGTYYLDVQYYNSIGGVVTDGANGLVVVDGAWHRPTSTNTPGAGAVTARVRVVAEAATWATLAWRRVKFEQGSTATAFSIEAAAAAAQAEANAASADAATALNQLTDIASDGKLTADEKVQSKQRYNTLTAEQSGIDAQATSYGITTEKANYDGAITALKNYLKTTVGVLDASFVWTGITGTTAITRATWDSNWTTAYTAKTTLLNAIYAAAKSKADTAQATANTATGQVSQLPVINGGFDIAPTGYGWNADPGSGWAIDTAGNTPGVGPNSAVHPAGSGGIQVFRNNGLAACGPGQVYKTQALIKAAGANGSCAVAISWVNASLVEISATTGTLVTGTTTAGSYALGTAPAGTVYARTILVANGHTAGTYYVDNVVCTQYPSSLDEVPDGAAKFGAIYNPAKQTGIAQPGQNLIPNPSGALGFSGLPGFSWIGGAQQQMQVVADDTLGNVGPEFVCWFPGTGAVDQGFSFIVPCTVSPVTLSADLCMQTAATATPFIELRFLNASGTEINTSIRPHVTAVIGPLARYSVTQAPPSGTASITVVVRFAGTMSANSVATWRNLKLEVGSVATPFNDFASQFGNQLTNPGSGQQIGDQRNLISSITRNLGITRSAVALTANGGGAVDINAHTIQMGSASVSYSAKLNAVTGLATSSSYYIYTRDNYAGGSPTWFAGTNQNTVNSFDDAYNAGVVTIPTSGSSGGGSGGGGISGCVAADMLLRRGLTARQLAQRWRWWWPCILRGQDGWHFVRRRPRIMSQPCCRITVADGSTLDCSLSTPVTVRTGESIQAPMVYGHDLWTDSGWQRVINVELLPGERAVVRISTGGHSFLAGAVAHLRISTHNTIKA